MHTVPIFFGNNIEDDPNYGLFDWDSAVHFVHGGMVCVPKEYTRNASPISKKLYLCSLKTER